MIIFSWIKILKCILDRKAIENGNNKVQQQKSRRNRRICPIFPHEEERSAVVIIINIYLSPNNIYIGLEKGRRI